MGAVFAAGTILATEQMFFHPTQAGFIGQSENNLAST